jgi:hypothetical protein
VTESLAQVNSKQHHRVCADLRNNKYELLQSINSYTFLQGINRREKNRYFTKDSAMADSKYLQDGKVGKVRFCPVAGHTGPEGEQRYGSTVS